MRRPAAGPYSTSCANHGHERKLLVTMDHFNQDASEHLLETVSVDAVSSLDEKGKLIIEQLQQDGRRSYSAIARAVGLSEAAVRQRITRLVKEQIVKIVAVTNPLQIGFSRQAMVQITTEGDVVGTADRLAEIPQVVYCVVTAGAWDVVLEILCENDHHLLQLLQQIRSTEGVRHAETLTFLSLRKQEYDWGTR